jgi:putative transposase
VQRVEKAGFPRFKPVSRYHSFTYKEVGNGARLDNGVLVLAKIGRISVHWSRPIEGTPKTATISKVADGWYVAMSCGDVPVHPLPSTGEEMGIDLGLEFFATLANGRPIFTPSYYRKAEAYLRRCQRRVARRKKGSHRRRKAVVLLAKAHQHSANQRRDFHHKEACKLVTQDDVIYHEDLQMATMVSNHHLAKSISDAGWKASGGGQSRVHQPKVFRARLWRHGAEGFIRPLACVPALWDEPASGPQCCREHPGAGAGTAVGRDTAFRRQRRGAPHA